MNFPVDESCGGQGASRVHLRVFYVDMDSTEIWGCTPDVPRSPQTSLYAENPRRPAPMDAVLVKLLQQRTALNSFERALSRRHIFTVKC